MIRTQLQRLVTGLHSRLYRWTGGGVGGSIFGAPMLVLTTTGRKTGRPRQTPLVYLRDGKQVVLVASNGGNPQHPAWYWNLRDHPDAEIQVRGKRIPVTAEVAGPDERARLWPRIVQLYPGYEQYQRRTAREIPLLILRDRIRRSEANASVSIEG